MKKELYFAPEVEVTSVAVEAGFSISGEIGTQSVGDYESFGEEKSLF